MTEELKNAIGALIDACKANDRCFACPISGYCCRLDAPCEWDDPREDGVFHGMGSNARAMHWLRLPEVPRE